MSKIDFKKVLKQLYSASPKEPVIVDVPTMNYLMIDGTGDPNTAREYADAIETLYPVAYGLKFMIKKGETAIDYAVMPLEGFWWTDDMSQFSAENKAAWKWTMLIMQPEFVTENLFRQGLEQVVKAKNPPSAMKIRFESYSEGRSAQIMHIGPYSEEAPTIARLHDFIKEKGLRLKGKHHEIYLGDPRKTAPERLKTIIRQPVE